MAMGGLIVGGILFLFLAIIGYVLPIAGEEGYSIPQVAALCNSGMGQLGQAFSGDIVKACSEYNAMLYGIYGSALLGLILIVVGSVVQEKKRINNRLKKDTIKENLHKVNLKVKKVN